MKIKIRHYLLLAPLLLFISGLLLRKSGWSFASAIIILSGLWISIFCISLGLLKVLRRKSVPGIPAEIIYGVVLALLLFRQQYWIKGNGMSEIALFILVIAVLYNYVQKKYKKPDLQVLPPQWSTFLNILFNGVLIFLAFTGVFLNPKDFHNFYRYSTYEEYLRAQYPAISIEVADSLLRIYHKESEETIKKSNNFLNIAEGADSSKEFRRALRYYNLAINENPWNAEAYFKRGYMKMYHLELNNDLAFSSVIDFSESIRIRPDHADSYFQRGAALAYLDKKKRVCEDMKKAFSLDSSLEVWPFIRKFCPGDSTGFVPLHP